MASGLWNFELQSQKTPSVNPNIVNSSASLQNQLLQQQIDALKKQNAQTWKQIDPVLTQTDAQKAAENTLRGQMTDAGYQGNVYAPNEYEGQIKSTLADYMANNSSRDLLTSASKQVQDTLAGNYDPNTSQYYQGLRQSADLNLSDALARYKQGQYLKGNLRSTTTDAGQGRLLAENSANMNTVLGQLAQQERQNQVNAVGQAQNIAWAQDTLESGKLGTLTNTSNYLRGLTQQQYDAEYARWKANKESQTNAANTLFSTAQTYLYPQYALQ